MNFLNPKQNMPDMSEMLTSWLGGGTAAKKAIKAGKSSKASRRT